MKATKAKSSKRPQKIRELRVLSYNIHQGITVDRSKLEFELLRSTLESLQADIILLQEVAGRTSGRGKDPYRIDISHQMESLVGKIWPYHAYQKNVVFTKRFHGNAILSRFPILKWNLINITVKSLKKRGVLHGEIEIPGLKKPLHVFTAHLGLLQYERHKQVEKICRYISKEIPEPSPLILGGDFNDWRQRASEKLEQNLNLEEAFLKKFEKHAKTFPSRMPVLRLDRIYYRGFQLQEAYALKGKPWKYLSDHLPVIAHFKY